MGCPGGTGALGTALVLVLSPQPLSDVTHSVPSHMTQLHPQHQRILTQRQTQR